MKSYAAFIGHQPHISLAELTAAVSGFRLRGVVQGTVVIFESSAELDAGFLHRLGGTMVLAEECGTSPTMGDVPALLADALTRVKGKATFSLRTAGLRPPEIKTLYRACKDNLRKHGRASRYVGNENQAAAVPLLRDSGILDGKGGCELCIVRDGDRLWVGRTLGAHDIDAYTARDIGKPVRDTTVGLLPPKLAQVLLNLGVWLAGDATHGKSKDPFVVYDPFCGTGVIPIECLLRGFPVLCSDASEKAVKGCAKNLEWTYKHFDLKKSVVPSAVWKQNALKPLVVTGHGIKTMPKIIITETTLGPSLRSRPTLKEIQTMRTEAERLEEAFLRNVAATLPGVSVACTWPIWYSSKSPVFLEKLLNRLPEIGFEVVLPPGVQPSAPQRHTLVYRRPQQFVGREIVLLRARKS